MECKVIPEINAEFAPTPSREREKPLARLSEAVSTLLRTKGFQGVPDDLVEHWTRVQHSLLTARQLWAASVHWPEPNAEMKSRMWEALGWLRYLLPSDSKLVLLICAGIKWKTMARFRDQHLDEVTDDFDAAIRRIEDGIAAEERIAA